MLPPLGFFCIAALARHPDKLIPDRRPIPASPALLDAVHNIDDPCFHATLAQLVQPLPPHLRDRDIPLSHPALFRLQHIPDHPDFSLLTLLSLPYCPPSDVPHLASLHRLVALDLRGSSVSSSALLRLPPSLRILSLHGCPNVDADILPTLDKLFFLSAVDLRFTRCSSHAVTAHLSSLGFRPSTLSSLFHPAPLAIALSSLEKLASSAPVPIPLYSCPLHAVFRLHIEQLDRLPSVSSSCQNAPKRTKNLLPMSAQAVQSSHGAHSDPLAFARTPPPWTAPPHRRTDHSLNKPLKVDPARLHNRASDPIADMVHHFSRKRPRVQSEFAKARTNIPVKQPNPFARPHPPPTSKPLKPITSFKPPILPKELLPKPAPSLKQTRLAFGRKRG